MLLMFAAQAPQTQAVPQWMQILAAALALPTAAIGIMIAYRTQQKVRLENLKLQRELLDQPAPDPSSHERFATRDQLRGRPEAFTAAIEDFVVRFIILYVATMGYGLFESTFHTVIGTGSVLVNLQTALLNDAFSLLAIGTQALATLGRWVLYLSLGYPLLRDILDYFGISLRAMLKWKA